MSFVENLCKRFEQIMESEETLNEYWSKSYNFSKFDRTDNAWILVNSLFKEVFPKHYPGINPTQQDMFNVSKECHEYLDYNLASQLILNLQLPAHYFINVPHSIIEDLLKKLATYNGAPNPVDKKAKYASADMSSQPWFNDYNEALGLIKASSIADEFKPIISFRLSPKSSTPSFADSSNMSMLNPAGAKYIVTTDRFKVYTTYWDDQAIEPAISFDEQKGAYVASDINYVFNSKSGGEILNKVLFTRKKLVKLYSSDLDIVNVLPRLNSIMYVVKKNSKLDTGGPLAITDI